MDELERGESSIVALRMELSERSGDTRFGHEWLRISTWQLDKE